MVRVIEIGLNPAYIAKFYRTEVEKQFVSNYNNSVYSSL